MRAARRARGQRRRKRARLRRGRGGGIDVALVGNDYGEIFSAAKALSAAIEEQGELLSEPDISYEPTQPQLSVEIDRRRAADLGVDLSNLASTLRAMIDGDEIVDLNVGDEVRVTGPFGFRSPY